MTQEKIDKIIELARRGVDGEMASARRILIRLGVSWEVPSKPFTETAKETFGFNTIKKYKISIELSGDVFLYKRLCERMIKNFDNKNFSWYGDYMEVKCTPSQLEAINNVFARTRRTFSDELNQISAKIIYPLFV